MGNSPLSGTRAALGVMSQLRTVRGPGPLEARSMSGCAMGCRKPRPWRKPSCVPTVGSYASARAGLSNGSARPATCTKSLARAIMIPDA